MPSLSIVIPAFNEEKLLPATLEAVRSSAVSLATAGIDHEVIVCDNNSTDATAAAAEAGGARVVFEPVNQIGRARNTGAAAATGEWLLFLDADSLPSPELFADLAEHLLDPGVIGGGSLLRMELAYPAARAVMAVWHGVSRLCRYAAGAFVFVRTDAFREVGGFDLNYFAGEEIFLSKKLKRLARRSGRRFVILTEHPLETSARKLALYKPAEHLKFMARAMLTGGRSLKRRETCDIWYDGRR